MKLSTALFIIFIAALILTLIRPPLPAADSVAGIVPPEPPKHERRQLTTGSELAEDLGRGAWIAGFGLDALGRGAS